MPMNSHALRRGPLRLAVLLAMLCFAQLQGLAHGISHLSHDRGAPHASVCGACVAAAETAAAPPPSAAAIAVAVASGAVPPGSSAATAGLRRVAAYRSRGPPATSI